MNTSYPSTTVRQSRDLSRSRNGDRTPSFRPSSSRSSRLRVPSSVHDEAPRELPAQRLPMFTNDVGRILLESLSEEQERRRARPSFDPSPVPPPHTGNRAARMREAIRSISRPSSGEEGARARRKRASEQADGMSGDQQGLLPSRGVARQRVIHNDIAYTTEDYRQVLRDRAADVSRSLTAAATSQRFHEVTGNAPLRELLDSGFTAVQRPRFTYRPFAPQPYQVETVPGTDVPTHVDPVIDEQANASTVRSDDDDREPSSASSSEVTCMDPPLMTATYSSGTRAPDGERLPSQSTLAEQAHEYDSAAPSHRTDHTGPSDASSNRFFDEDYDAVLLRGVAHSVGDRADHRRLEEGRGPLFSSYSPHKKPSLFPPAGRMTRPSNSHGDISLEDLARLAIEATSFDVTDAAATTPSEYMESRMRTQARKGGARQNFSQQAAATTPIMRNGRPTGRQHASKQSQASRRSSFVASSSDAAHRRSSGSRGGRCPSSSPYTVGLRRDPSAPRRQKNSLPIPAVALTRQARRCESCCGDLIDRLAAADKLYSDNTPHKRPVNGMEAGHAYHSEIQQRRPTSPHRGRWRPGKGAASDISRERTNSNICPACLHAQNTGYDHRPFTHSVAERYSTSPTPNRDDSLCDHLFDDKRRFAQRQGARHSKGPTVKSTEKVRASSDSTAINAIAQGVLEELVKAGVVGGGLALARAKLAASDHSGTRPSSADVAADWSRAALSAYANIHGEVEVKPYGSTEGTALYSVEARLSPKRDEPLLQTERATGDKTHDQTGGKQEDRKGPPELEANSSMPPSALVNTPQSASPSSSFATPVRGTADKGAPSVPVSHWNLSAAHSNEGDRAQMSARDYSSERSGPGRDSVPDLRDTKPGGLGVDAVDHAAAKLEETAVTTEGGGRVSPDVAVADEAALPTAYSSPAMPVSLDMMCSSVSARQAEKTAQDTATHDPKSCMEPVREGASSDDKARETTATLLSGFFRGQQVLLESLEYQARMSVADRQQAARGELQRDMAHALAMQVAINVSIQESSPVEEAHNDDITSPVTTVPSPEDQQLHEADSQYFARVTAAFTAALGEMEAYQRDLVAKDEEELRAALVAHAVAAASLFPVVAKEDSTHDAGECVKSLEEPGLFTVDITSVESANVEEMDHVSCPSPVPVYQEEHGQDDEEESAAASPDELLEGEDKAPQKEFQPDPEVLARLEEKWQSLLANEPAVRGIIEKTEGEIRVELYVEILSYKEGLTRRLHEEEETAARVALTILLEDVPTSFASENDALVTATPVQETQGEIEAVPHVISNDDQVSKREMHLSPPESSDATPSDHFLFDTCVPRADTEHGDVLEETPQDVPESNEPAVPLDVDGTPDVDSIRRKTPWGCNLEVDDDATESTDPAADRGEEVAVPLSTNDHAEHLSPDRTVDGDDGMDGNNGKDGVAPPTAADGASHDGEDEDDEEEGRAEPQERKRRRRPSTRKNVAVVDAVADNEYAEVSDPDASVRVAAAHEEPADNGHLEVVQHIPVSEIDGATMNSLLDTAEKETEKAHDCTEPSAVVGQDFSHDGGDDYATLPPLDEGDAPSPSVPPSFAAGDEEAENAEVQDGDDNDAMGDLRADDSPCQEQCLSSPVAEGPPLVHVAVEDAGPNDDQLFTAPSTEHMAGINAEGVAGIPQDVSQSASALSLTSTDASSDDEGSEATAQQDQDAMPTAERDFSRLTTANDSEPPTSGRALPRGPGGRATSVTRGENVVDTRLFLLPSVHSRDTFSSMDSGVDEPGGSTVVNDDEVSSKLPPPPPFAPLADPDTLVEGANVVGYPPSSPSEAPGSMDDPVLLTNPHITVAASATGTPASEGLLSPIPSPYDGGYDLDIGTANEDTARPPPPESESADAPLVGNSANLGGLADRPATPEFIRETARNADGSLLRPQLDVSGTYEEGEDPQQHNDAVPGENQPAPGILGSGGEESGEGVVVEGLSPIPYPDEQELHKKGLAEGTEEQYVPHLPEHQDAQVVTDAAEALVRDAKDASMCSDELRQAPTQEAHPIDLF